MDEITVEIIADGKHLPPSLIELVYKLKGPHAVCLVTDSMRAAGTFQKTSIFGSLARGKKVIIEDSVAKMPGRKKFAGSVATADKMIRNILYSTTIPLVDAVKMMSITPARIIGIGSRKGSIDEGKDADIIVFNDNMDIKMVIADGEIVLNRLNILNWVNNKPQKL